MASEKTLKKITVVAKQPSRWRAGLAFGAEPSTVEVTAEQLAMIEADPLLAVVATPSDEDDKGKGKKG